MLRSRRACVVVAALATLLATVAVTGPADAGTSLAATSVRTASGPTASSTPRLAATTRKHPYTLHSGVLFNAANSTGPYQFRLMNRVINAINASPRRSEIRIATWSFFMSRATDALIRAHQRGVTVRLLMARAKSKESADFRRLRSALAKSGNSKRVPARRSKLKTCPGACRSPGGTMHTKLYLFSRAGRSHDIAMWGSPNLTRASAVLQWNDLYTSVGRQPIYDHASDIYDQLWRGRTVNEPYTVVRSGPVGLAALPYHGSGDWISNQLHKVRCHGATGGTGVGGRTKIRVAQAVIRGSVGNRIAALLKQRWDQGCDVRIVYTIRGVRTKQILNASTGRGPVPMRHYVVDANGDGVFDKYLHIKALAVSGVMGTDTSTMFAMNGSENWADMSLHNDELVGYFSSPRTVAKYLGWIDWLWEHVPSSARLAPTARLFPAQDPYAGVDLD